MKTFKDSESREWVIQVNYSAGVRVKASTGIDLFALEAFEQLGADPLRLIDVLRAICAEQIEQRGITARQFVDALNGDSIESATDALVQEIIAFFPKRRREMLQKLHATAGQVQDKALAMVEEKLQSGEVLRKLEASLSDASGNSPAPAAASIPVPSPSGNSA